jgi:hypothetical protein
MGDPELGSGDNAHEGVGTGGYFINKIGLFKVETPFWPILRLL